MKGKLFSALLFSSVSVFAQEKCFQLSFSPDLWSRSPEVMCISDAQDNTHTITLKKLEIFQETTVATFKLQLLMRAKSLDVNMDDFGIASPSNSLFNELKISFDGQRDITTGKESGKVAIGANEFFYRSMP
jgi:hypothetical protein